MTLIHVNLQQIHQTFVSYIDLAMTNQPGVDELDDVYQEKVARLDEYMRVLTQLATEGMEEHLSALLNTLLQEWAIKEAVELLLRSPVIDSSDPGLQRSFWEKLGRQHQALSSELLLHMQHGKEQRARAEQERAQSWQSVACRSLEDQRQQSQQWFRQQAELSAQYQQTNQQWAHVAMTGVQQAQLGVKQWYDFAASTQQNVTNMLAGTEQRQAAFVEQAVHRNRKWTTRITIVGLILIGIVALFGCAFFSMMHLY